MCADKHQYTLNKTKCIYFKKERKDNNWKPFNVHCWTERGFVSSLPWPTRNTALQSAGIQCLHLEKYSHHLQGPFQSKITVRTRSQRGDKVNLIEKTNPGPRVMAQLLRALKSTCRGLGFRSIKKYFSSPIFSNTGLEAIQYNQNRWNKSYQTGKKRRKSLLCIWHDCSNFQSSTPRISGSMDSTMHTFCFYILLETMCIFKQNISYLYSSSRKTKRETFVFQCNNTWSGLWLSSFELL